MCSLLKEAEYFIDLDDVDPVHVFALLLASISPGGWLNSYVVNNGDESVIELLFGDDCYLQTFGVLDCMSMSIAITTRLQRNVQDEACGASSTVRIHGKVPLCDQFSRRSGAAQDSHHLPDDLLPSGPA